MRTTLILNDEIMLAAKQRAAERKTSLSALVNEALLLTLKETHRNENQPSFKLPTFSPVGSETVNTSPQELHDLMVAEEFQPYKS